MSTPDPRGERTISPKTKPVTLAADAPHLPAAFSVADHTAVQALQRGAASPEQQQRALDWIIQQAARAYDLSFRDGDALGTAFAEGRRFAGLQIIRVLNTRIEEQK